MSTRAIEHCDLQLSVEDEYLLHYAAQLSGLSLACFIRQVALREAEKVIGREKVVNLTPQESKELLELLDKPFAPNEKLQAAMVLSEKITNNTKRKKNDFSF